MIQAASCECVFGHGYGMLGKPAHDEVGKTGSISITVLESIWYNH